MASQSIVCASCRATVPYGRLSCPSCGELLASVAGAARRVPAERPAKRTARASRQASTTAAPRATRSAPSVLVDVAPPATAVATAEPVEAPSTDGAGWDAPEPPGTFADGPEWPVERPETPFAVSSAAVDARNGESEASVSLPYVLRPVSPPTAAVSPSPAAGVLPAIPDLPVASPPSAPPEWPVASAPGAYVPPPMITATPAGAPAPARAWAGHPTDPSTSDAAADPARSAGAIMDAARVPEFVGWLAVAGSAMAAVGFVLPWGVTVIGASGVGYFDRWGMAGPFHPIVVLALLGVLGLALVRNPIPLWIRVGLPGLGLGALLIGLGWPYLVALPGAGPGVLVVAIGAIILIVAGIIALVTDRHAVEDRSV
jgi:hypothetical protein